VSAEPSPVLLRAEGLTVGYGKMPILHDVTLEVRAGEMVSVIGPNGAGKSTAFKTIVGFLRPQSGRVRFDGQDITGLRPDQVLPRGLAYVPQGRIVFPQMTALENLEMGAYIERDGARIRAALERVYGLFPILADRRGQKAGTMSGGEQQMVAIGRALMTSPKLIMLDEPSLGLAPKFVSLIFEKLDEMRRAGFTLMVVEQNAAKALTVADRAYVLELGRNRFEGAGRALLEDLGQLLSDDRPATFALLDLHGMRAVNDVHGLAAGDELLVTLARQLESALVGDGHVYRLGGVQLCALLAESGAGASRVVSAACRALSSDKHAVGCRAATVELPREARSIAAVLRLADARLARYGHVATARA